MMFESVGTWEHLFLGYSLDLMEWKDLPPTEGAGKELDGFAEQLLIELVWPDCCWDGPAGTAGLLLL